MGRIRTVKPEFFEDPKIAGWAPLARVVYIGLWTLADDCGRLQWDVDKIRGNVAWKDTPDSVRKAADQVVSDGKVLTYEVDGETYGVIVNWWHQWIDKPEPAMYPPPPDEVAEAIVRKALANAGLRKKHLERVRRQIGDCSRNILGMLSERSGTIPETRAERSQNPQGRNREQGTGNREQGVLPPSPQGVEGGWEQLFLEDLRKTGKMPALTTEVLKLAMRGYPMAGMEKRWEEIVEELKAMSDPTITNPLVWLRSAMSRMETRVLREERGQEQAAAGSGDAGGEHRPDLTWMQDLADEKEKKKEAGGGGK